MPIACYAAKQAKAPLEPYSYDPGDLSDNEVAVSITHCGLCHSDIHLIDDDWGMSQYPLVPGHEVIGTIEATGRLVKHLKPGQRVGVGWQADSCGHCDQCVAGDENLCAENQPTCVGHYGGFAEAVRCDARFAFPIPDAITSENAGPLLCGGITVFTPLRHYGVHPIHRVGVVGIGGLGHIALQFAHAFGCEVTAFSHSPGKEKEAKGFGAHHFVDSSDPKALEKRAGTLDFILSTVNAQLDWTAYANLLRPNGKLCLVGVPNGPIQIELFPLLVGRRSLCSSPIGGRVAMREMLEFAARHGIEAKTEVLPMREVNAALDKVRANKARYRMVLKN